MIVLLLVAIWDHSYEADIDLGYDDNIYAYSPSYIDDFLNGVNAYRFPFETYDDLVTSIDLRLRLRNRLLGRRTTTVNFGAGTNNYLVNNQKNYQTYVLGFRQSFGPAAVKISYQLIPGFLIRYYRNPLGASTEYIACEATYHTATAKLTYTTANDVTISAAYGHRWDDYIDEFNRYDARSHIAELGIAKRLARRLDFEFGYEYRSSTCDSADAVALDTELTPDGSFYQHTLNAALGLSAFLLRPTDLSISYGYGLRHYTTSDAEDLLHFGRRDQRHRIDISTRSHILTGVRMKLFFTYQWRNADSEVFADIKDIKDYTRYRAGAGLQFYH